MERRSIQQHRWWSIDELPRITETVFPENLASLVADLRGHEGPNFPVLGSSRSEEC